jgi:NADH:ubiquinone oxidoreductase subunit K
MVLNQFLFLSAFLFCVGVYGVIVRKNAVLVLMSVELMINAVNLNLIAFSMYNNNLTGVVDLSQSSQC